MIAKITQTRQTRVLYIISILIAGGALLLVLFLHFRVPLNQKSSFPEGYEGTLSIGNVSIPITIASTQDEQEKGLSNTTSLEANTGKLFVFKVAGRYGFWMKDMNYPLDIIWMDKDLRIVSIDKNVPVDSYPNIFYPPTDVSYVLEVNAGFSTKNNLEINQLMTFSNNPSF